MSEQTLPDSNESLDKFFETGGQSPPPEVEVAEPAPPPEVVPESSTPAAAEVAETPAVAPAAPAAEKPDRHVPLAALHEERQRRQELQRELEETRRRTERIEQTWQDIQSRLTAQQLAQQEAQLRAEQERQLQENPPPKWEEDPAGFLRWQAEQNAKALAEQQRVIEEFRQQQLQQSQQELARQQFTAQVVSQEARFRSEHPDYDQAVNFIKQRRDQELSTWGITDPVRRAEIVQQEIVFLASNALQSGANPAEKAYDMAQRFGYRNSAQVQQAAAAARAAVPATSGAVPATSGAVPATSAAAQASEAARLINAAKGQAAATTLAGVGAAPTPGPSLEQLAQIEDAAEFDKMWDKMFAPGKSLL